MNIPPIGASTGMYYDVPLSEALTRLAHLGFQTVELYRHSAELRTEWERLKVLADAFGISLISWHDHYECTLKLSPGDTADQVYDRVRWRLELCRKIGIKQFVFHCDVSLPKLPAEQQEVVLEALRHGVRHARSLEVVPVVETADQFLTVSAVQALIETLGCPAIGICLDVGHVRVAGEHPGAELRAASNRLRSLHIQDNLTQGPVPWFEDRHLAPGEGTLDWREFAKAYAAHGGNAHLFLELSCWQSARAGQANTCGYTDTLPMAQRDALLTKGRETLQKAFSL